MSGQPADRRAWLAVGGLVVLLLGLGVDDRRAHAAEAARVDDCVATVGTAQRLADRTVGAMAEYIRPALDGSYTPEVRTRLSRLVAGAARKSVAPLDAARSRCAQVEVRPWHGDLAGRVDGCVETLDVRLRWLDEVSRDGTAAFRSTPHAAAGCAGPGTRS